jgi:hypothetical protein
MEHYMLFLADLVKGNVSFCHHMSVNFSHFLPNFSSFGKVVSEKIFFRNQPIQNKNGLWWQCLLTDWDEMSNLYRGTSIDASYQVSVHLAKQFQRIRFFRN